MSPGLGVHGCNILNFGPNRNDSRSPGSISYLPSFFTKLENTSPMVKSKKQEIFRKLNSSGGGDSDMGKWDFFHEPQIKHALIMISSVASPIMLEFEGSLQDICPTHLILEFLLKCLPAREEF